MLDDNRHITRLNKFLIVFFFLKKKSISFPGLKICLRQVEKFLLFVDIVGFFVDVFHSGHSQT